MKAVPYSGTAFFVFTFTGHVTPVYSVWVNIR